MMPWKSQRKWLLVVGMPPSMLLLSAAFSTEAVDVRWYLVNRNLNEQGNSLSLGDGKQKIELEGDWSCTVGEASKQLSLDEFRTTTCDRGTASFEFSVQCEELRPKHRTQIRFKTPDGTFLDFIEVGCEYMESSL